METFAKEIMTSEMLTARNDITLEDALKIMVNNKITGMPVVDKNGIMVGVFSEYDVLTQIGSLNPEDPSVYQETIHFSKEVETLQEDTPLHDVLDRFLKSRYRRLPVVNKEGKLLGIITRRDLMRVFFYRARLMVK